MDETRIPILVGSGQITQREPDPKVALHAMDLTAAAARKAAEDAGAGAKLLQALDTIVVLRSFSDTSWRFKSPFGVILTRNLFETRKDIVLLPIPLFLLMKDPLGAIKDHFIVG